MKGLIHKPTLRKLILNTILEKRPGWGATQVSGTALDKVEERITNYTIDLVEKLIHQHAGKGKTFRDVY